MVRRRNQHRNVVVKTTLGTAVLAKDAPTFVNVSGKTFFQKQVDELELGDLVLYRNDYITAELEEVEPYLVGSARYAAADSALHTARGGIRLKRFGYDLVRSLASFIGSDPLSLEGRLFSTGGLRDEEVARLSEQVRVDLSGNDFKFKYEKADTFRSWVKGQTTGPGDWHVMDVLASRYRPFSAWLVDAPPAEFSEEGLNLKGHYDVFMSIRKGVMRYLSPDTGESDASSSSRSKKGMSIKPEIEMVVSQFVRRIDRTFSVASVLAIEEPQGEQFDKSESIDMALKKGIVTGIQIPQKDYQKATVEELYYDFGIIEATLHCSIHALLPHIEREDLTHDNFPGLRINYYIAKTMIRHFLDEQSLKMSFRQSSQAISTEKIAGEVIDLNPKRFRIGLESGEYDRMLDLEKGTLLELTNLYTRFANAIPDGFWSTYTKYCKANSAYYKAVEEAEHGRDGRGYVLSKFRSKLKQATKVKDQLLKEAGRRYGVTLDKGRYFHHIIAIAEPLYSQIGDRAIDDESMVSRIKQIRVNNYINGGIPIYYHKRDHVQGVLNKYDMGHLMRFFPRSTFA